MSQAREADRAARIKAEREVREFGEKLVDAEDEVKSLRRELGEVERSLNSELDEKNAVSSCFIVLIIWAYFLIVLNT